MKVYIIKASAGSEFSKYKKMTGGPTQSIFSLAAATPEGIKVDMADETIGIKADLKTKADVVAIFMSTPDAIRAYELADHYRASGKMVVLGGLHTKFMQEEASSHADTLLIGEPEEIWEEMLRDFSKDQLKKKYERTGPFDLARVKPYPTNIIHPKKYNWTWSVLVSRGCKNRCEFCLVHKFFKNHTFRPVEDVVAELRKVKYMGVSWAELHADNLTLNREYALELFRALKPLKMNLFAETTVLIARDEELLQAAKEAGIKAFLLGIETISKEALKAQNKAFVDVARLKDDVKKIQSYGIKVVSDFLFGFDEHDKNIFKETLEVIKEIKFDEVYPHMVIPFPGSDTYNKLEKEGRILTRDWSKYEGGNAVYQPKLMSPKELEDGLKWFNDNYYTLGQWIKSWWSF